MAAAAASAPGKVILLGEHAVVYGEPAVAVAIGGGGGLRTRVRVDPLPEGGSSVVNGQALTPHYHAFIQHALDVVPPGVPVAVETLSQVPSAAGLGSSAALTTATVAALLALKGAWKDEETLARGAYEAEWRAQGGRGSPTDTTIATHGGGILVDREPGPRLLWSVSRGDRRWHLHDLDPPPLRLVIGNTHERGRTAEQVAKVARLVARSGFAKEVVADVGAITRSGLAALAARDLPALGKAMDRAHNALTILGVSTPRLDRYIDAARRAGALGAKLTGSGGGGSMIALVADDGEAVAAALRKAGCPNPLVVETGGPGTREEAP